MSDYIFKNEFGNIINENQIDYNEEHYKVTLIGSNEKIIERIQNSKVNHTHYY